MLVHLPKCDDNKICPLHVKMSTYIYMSVCEIREGMREYMFVIWTEGEQFHFSLVSGPGLTDNVRYTFFSVFQKFGSSFYLLDFFPSQVYYVQYKA